MIVSKYMPIKFEFVVCLFWHLQLPKIKLGLPWLLQAVDDNVEASHAFFNPIDKKYYYLDVPNVLQGKICKGSSYGWVVTVEDTVRDSNSFNKDCNKIYLINPLTSARIELPSRDRFPDICTFNPYQLDNEYSLCLNEEDLSRFYTVSAQEITDSCTLKFVMSSDPSRSKDCVIATIYGAESRVACCTLKNKQWNPLLSKDLDKKVKDRFLDIIFHKGKLYALTDYGLEREVHAFENINDVKRNPPNPRMTLIVRYNRNPVIERSPVIVRNRSVSFIVIEDHLVESSDRSCLMLVERAFRDIEKEIEEGSTFKVCQTLYFKVYKMDPINRCLVELKSIGEDAIVLGINTPIAISARNSVGYKGNHIYYTDIKHNYNRIHYKLENSEVGVFSLADGTLQPLCGLKSSSNVIWPPPIWISPQSS